MTALLDVSWISLSFFQEEFAVGFAEGFFLGGNGSHPQSGGSENQNWLHNTSHYSDFMGAVESRSQLRRKRNQSPLVGVSGKIFGTSGVRSIQYMLKTLIFPCLLPFLLAGCDVKDDPELTRQLAETKVNIEELEAEMEAVEAEIKASRIPDPSEQLDPLTLEAEAAAARKVALEKEVRELGEAREKAVEELEAYKEKYRLR